jgi:hypothetical protein
MRKRSALRSNRLADHGVTAVAARLASPLVAAFAGGFLGCFVSASTFSGDGNVARWGHPGCDRECAAASIARYDRPLRQG